MLTRNYLLRNSLVLCLTIGLLWATWPARAGSQATPVATPQNLARLGLARPAVTGGSLPAEAFADRLFSQFKKRDDQLTPIVLDRYDEPERIRQHAKKEQCAYLLFLTVKGEEKSTLGKFKKYKVEVTFTLEEVATGAQVLTQALKAERKNSEESIADVMKQIIDVVTPVVVRAAPPPVPNPMPVAVTAPGAPVATPVPAPSVAPPSVAMAQAPRLVVQSSHEAPVANFVYSPDGQLLGTLATDGVVKVWLVRTGQEIISFSGQEIVGLAFSPDSKRLAALNQNGVVRIYDLATGQYQRLTPIRPKSDGSGLGSLLTGGGLLSKIKGNQADTLALRFSTFRLSLPMAFTPSGRRLVHGDVEGVKVWDLNEGKVVLTLDKDEDIPVTALSEDGRFIAGIVDTNKVKLWSADTGKKLKEFDTKIDPLTTLAFSHDNKLLACANRNGSFKVYDVETFKTVAEKVGTGEKVGGVFKKIGDWIPGDDPFSGLADALSGLRSVYYYFKSIRSVDFSPDNKTLVYNSGDNNIRFYDLTTKKEVNKITQDKGQYGQDTFNLYFKALCPVRFSPDGRTIDTCAEFNRVARYDINSGQVTSQLAVSKRGLQLSDLATANVFKNIFQRTTAAHFLNQRILVTSTFAGGVRLWDLERSSKPITLSSEVRMSANNQVPLSADGKYLASVKEDGKQLVVSELKSQKAVRKLDFTGPVLSYSLSPDGRFVAVNLGEQKKKLKFFDLLELNMIVYEVATGKEVFKDKDAVPNQYAFSPDGKRFVALEDGASLLDAYLGRQRTRIKMFDTTATLPWQPLFTEKVEQVRDDAYSPKAAFSYDSKLFAYEDEKGLKIRNVADNTVAYKRDLSGLDVGNVIFSPTETILTYTSGNNALHRWNYRAGTAQKLPLPSNTWGGLAYSPDGQSLALGSVENKIRLFDIAKEEETGYLLDPNGQEWMTVLPDGRFDSNALEEVEEVQWILPQTIYHPQPVEAFMRQYYEPRLFARVIAREEFAPVPNLSSINLTQPSVTITNITATAPDTAEVKVEVASANSAIQRNNAGQPLSSGVYDVRLFRDGQLVAASATTEKVAALTARHSDDLAAWRDTHRVALDANGRATLIFKNIKLPQRGLDEQIQFSAYAFNEDRVKSRLDKRAFTLPPVSKPRQGRAYVLTVGVNAYENSSFNLRYAASDAVVAEKAVTERLRASGQFAEVVSVSLISDYNPNNCNADKTNCPAAKKDATKENVRRALTSLARRTAPAQPVASATPTPAPSVKPGGKGSAPRPPKSAKPAVTPKPSATPPPVPVPAAAPVLASGFQPATPDDLVVVLFSSHGYADSAGNFYLIPYDTGPGSDKVFTKTVRDRSISSEELALWLRDVDAGEIVFVIDACHSTAAVEGQAFKPGPMGSRGLGQLAYDKGMRVLTATQTPDYAFEKKEVQQSLLTYALMRDGLETQKADFKPTDKTITLLELLEYGVDRVPLLHQAIARGIPPEQIPPEGFKGVDATPAPGSAPAAAAPPRPKAEATAARYQQPSLFDFTRKNRDFVLWKGSQ
jgi:WD40 repeat protein